MKLTFASQDFMEHTHIYRLFIGPCFAFVANKSANGALSSLERINFTVRRNLTHMNTVLPLLPCPVLLSSCEETRDLP